jgi:hypothetical protein
MAYQVFERETKMEVVIEMDSKWRGQILQIKPVISRQ